ncbi:uncharacterized protein L3040_007770 [Drepanopeziza brunnea f. sp. 'multigermtubi']|uniref:uncharacterized protein n=1 Tax=Drepanopeziza brunnea f. sp. 'multigermtubi' TaxID=698441 RepID=UPI0023897AF8|nr:hypothetical protein L3040_007770 [Drepanopeziza brunnea f. sp. 'multigermtubi']
MPPLPAELHAWEVVKWLQRSCGSGSGDLHSTYECDSGILSPDLKIRAVYRWAKAQLQHERRTIWIFYTE